LIYEDDENKETILAFCLILTHCNKRNSITEDYASVIPEQKLLREETFLSLCPKTIRFLTE